jgi:outer membrane protein assembly factor BamD (BamD/ComL family)
MLGVALACGARAQGTVRPPDKSMTEEAQAELTARHDLEVARQYFKLRKAYVAALSRAEELVAGYPTFSKRDEALYIAGMSSLYLADGKGKQKFTEKEVKEKNRTPEQLRLDAREYLSELVNNYPKSEFFAEADKELKKLGNSNGSQPAKAGDSIKPRA